MKYEGIEDYIATSIEQERNSPGFSEQGIQNLLADIAPLGEQIKRNQIKSATYVHKDDSVTQ
jgi:hypothetical protein